MSSLLSTTVENVRGVRFLLKIGLHALYGTPWTELTFYSHSIPPQELLMECVFHTLTYLPFHLPFNYQYLDIYVRNRNATKLVLLELRDGVVGNPTSLF